MYLVVAKTSQLDIRGDKLNQMVQSGELKHEHMQRFENAHRDHVDTYSNLLKSLKENNIAFQEVLRGEVWPDCKDVKAVITVGGDGTVLEASHNLNDSEVPLIGIRSSAMSVGFLCYVTENEIDLLANRLKQDEVNYLSVERLKAKVVKADGSTFLTPPVLNDFLYTNQNPAETTRYLFEFDGNKEEHKSSGVWISTAAGSTAAISAAGGEVYPIEYKQFQYVIREPYCPPGGCYLKTKSEFDPGKNNIMIENRCHNALLALDGHHGMISLGIGDHITFERASPLKIARKPD